MPKKKQRYLFIELNCPYCKEYLNIVDLRNSRLRPEDKVKIIDLTNSRTMDIEDHFLRSKLKVTNVPFLFLDGYKIVGASSRAWIEGFFDSYFKEEFLV